jgi:hypothetical protein
MSNHQVDIEEAKTYLPDLGDAAIGGIEIVMTKDNRPAMKLGRWPRASPPAVGERRRADHDVRRL